MAALAIRPLSDQDCSEPKPGKFGVHGAGFGSETSALSCLTVWCGRLPRASEFVAYRGCVRVKSKSDKRKMITDRRRKIINLKVMPSMHLPPEGPSGKLVNGIQRSCINLLCIISSTRSESEGRAHALLNFHNWNF